MKTKALVAVAVAGAVWSMGSIANQPEMMGQHETSHTYSYTTWPSSASEAPESLTTMTSLDTVTGGYKGWGPIPNFMGPSSVDESKPIAQIEKEREHRQHVAEVESERQSVWIANAPLRAEHENVGATRSEGRGFGFFGR